MDPFSGVVGAAIAGLLAALGWALKSLLPKYVQFKQDQELKKLEHGSNKDIKLIDIYTETITNMPNAMNSMKIELMAKMEAVKDEIVNEIKTNEYKDLFERVSNLEKEKK